MKQSRRALISAHVALAVLLETTSCSAATPVTDTGPALPLVSTTEVQPLLVNARQIAEALAFLGAPLSAVDRSRLARAERLPNDDAIAREIQAVLDPHCLVRVHLNPEVRVKVDEGPVRRALTQHAWVPFLVKLHNEAGWTGPIGVSSPQAGAVFGKEYCAPWDDNNPINGRSNPADPDAAAAMLRDRWLDLELFTQRPMNARLHGIGLEYAILCLRGRDAGRRAAVLAFDAGQGTQDLGFRGEIALTFSSERATDVTLRVKDDRGQPAVGAFLIRDAAQRLYPSPFKRVAPDFFFQPQIYRADGESVPLAPGEYVVEFSRGPESVKETRAVTVGRAPQTLEFQTKRWIDPGAFGYVSGDHHIHGAGCAHYTTPSLGVAPADIARQIQGEDLQVGAVLTWGPGFDFQKKFFTGRDDPAAARPHLLRYDIEVSGFGSYRTGHLCLLRLKDQHYPGGDSVEHWPTLGLSILKWAKRQGAITGSPHSGGGLQLAGEMRNATATYGTTIPFYEIPTFDGTGAVEFIVNLTHEVPGPDGRPVPAVDFIATCNTPFVNELTLWYHALNCGFRPRAAGETDFPCLSGERVGVGRTYVRVPGELSYDRWCQGLAEGRSYVTEGGSHLLDFTIEGTEVGMNRSEVRLNQPGAVRARVRAAALLDPTPREENPAWNIARSQTELTPPPFALPLERKPAYETGARPRFWHIERSRIADTRRVPVELVVNGQPVARREIVADGTLRELEFDLTIERSSWVAVRILGSSHTNPIFVIVGDRPIRASRRSAQWCLASVDAVWNRKHRFYAEAEMPEARAAYDHARSAYRRILAESAPD